MHHDQQGVQLISVQKKTITSHFSPCDNLTFWRLLQIDGGSTWRWPTVLGVAKEEAHLKAEPAALRRDQGGDGGRHCDGEVPRVASLDVREQRPEQFACLPVSKLTLSPLVANPPESS